MTKVLVWPADHDACAFYRLDQPARAVAAATGWEVNYTEAGITVVWSDRWEGVIPPESVDVIAVAPLDADVVVMQRIARRYWVDIIAHIQRQGIRVIIDMDDNLSAIPGNHFSHGFYDPSRHPGRNYEWAKKACQIADLVTVTTPALLDVYGYGHGRVLPNLVPKSYLEVEPEVQLMSAGWSGWVGTHPDDLQTTGGAIRRALDDNPGWGFHVIGSGRGVQDALGLADPPTNTGEQWVPLELYPNHLAELTVGVVPLKDTPFNRCKSSLKLLEMSSVGVPAVASPTPDNRRLYELGMGELARAPADWFKKVRALLRHDAYREEVASRSREAAALQTYEQHGHLWAEAWAPKSR